MKECCRLKPAWNFTKSNTLPWLFLAFFKLYKRSTKVTKKTAKLR